MPHPPYHPGRRIPFVLCCALVTIACGDSGDPVSAEPEPPNPWDSAPQSLAACTLAPPFSHPLVDLADLVRVGPLGYVDPPGKTFPTSHMGFNTFWEPGMPGAIPAPVWAPADIVVVYVAFLRFTNPSTGEVVLEDYNLQLQPCREILMYLGHLSEVAPAILEAAGPIPGPGAECGEPYMANQILVEICGKRTEIQVSAGERLGTMGGLGQSAMDVGLFDHTRPPLDYVNPARTGGEGSMTHGNWLACPLDYFTAPIRNAYLALTPRTAAPRCGEIMQDVRGRLQGRWFVDDRPGDDRHGGFFLDWIDPNLHIVAIGHSVPSIPAGGYRFRPESSGRVNRAFRDLAPAPEPYCFERQDHAGPWLHDVVILVDFVDEDRIRVEGAPRTACGDPAGWTLSGAAVEFRR